MEMTEQDKDECLKEARKGGELVKFLCENNVDYALAEEFVWKDAEKHSYYRSVFDDHKIERLFAALARKYTDGHYTIFRFTSGYKAGFGTPDIRGGGNDGNINLAPTFPSIREAMLYAIDENQNFQTETKETKAASFQEILKNCNIR